MDIALFGATGRTGRLVLERLVARGDRVRALARDAARLAARPGLDVIGGDARDAAAVARAVTGADAIVCCLGMHDITVPATDFSESLRGIVGAAKAAGVPRIVAIASAGVLDDARGGLRNEHGLPEVLANVAAEHTRNLRTLQASGLAWTLMCPIDLVDAPAGGVRWAFEDLPDGPHTGYADLADTIVAMLGRADAHGKRVGVVSAASQ
jgi:putative NADH-flavin reductase